MRSRYFQITEAKKIEVISDGNTKRSSENTKDFKLQMKKEETILKSSKHFISSSARINKNVIKEPVNHFQLLKNLLKYKRSIVNDYSYNKNNIDDDVCSICLGKCENVSKLNNCFHLFCWNCITLWASHIILVSAAKCPLCKLEFNLVESLSDSNMKKSFIYITKNNINDNVIEDNFDIDANDVDWDAIRANEEDNYGYELDGFCVDDSFVEYDSDINDDDEDNDNNKIIISHRKRKKRKKHYNNN